MAEQKKNKNENKQLTPAEVYNSGEAIQNRANVQREIQGPPRINYSHAFEKTERDQGELYTARKKWREDLKKRGFTKRNPPITIRSKQS